MIAAKPAPRTLLILVCSFLLAVFWVLVGPALAANANELVDETGGQGRPPTIGQGGSTKPAKKPPAGSGAPVDPYLEVETSTYGPTLATCPSSKGRQAKGAWLYYSWEFEKTSDRATPPPGTGWQFAGSYSNGHYFKRLMYTGKKVCAYPALKAYKTVECSIRYFVAVDRVIPNSKRVAEKSAPAGFTAGSSNYNACFHSGGRVAIRQPITVYGYYRTFTWRQAQNIRVEYTIEKDTWTGAWPAPKIVGWSPVHTTKPRLGMTGSLHCSGWNSPGVFHSDWAETDCLNTTGKPKKGQWMCVREPVQVDVSEPREARKMKTVAGGTPLQLMNDGKARLVVFNQKVTGDSIKVEKQSTHFTRSGTPWRTDLPVNGNVVELRSSASGGGLLKNATTTTSWSKNQGNLWVSAYQASNPGSKMTLTQHLRWSGKRTIQTVEITGVNAETGAISTGTRTITVPTSGSCAQSVDIQYIRAIGDAR